MPRFKDIDRDECLVGQWVTVWTDDHGQGGNIIACDNSSIQVENKLGDTFTFGWGVVSRVEVEVKIPLEECIQYDPDVCEGEVDYFSPYGFGGPLRCDYHVQKRIESYENSMERYADSSVPPDWFDESYAGERWSDDY